MRWIFGSCERYHKWKDPMMVDDFHVSAGWNLIYFHGYRQWVRSLLSIIGSHQSLARSLCLLNRGWIHHHKKKTQDVHNPGFE